MSDARIDHRYPDRSTASPTETPLHHDRAGDLGPCCCCVEVDEVERAARSVRRHRPRPSAERGGGLLAGAPRTRTHCRASRLPAARLRNPSSGMTMQAGTDWFAGSSSRIVIAAGVLSGARPRSRTRWRRPMRDPGGAGRGAIPPGGSPNPCLLPGRSRLKWPVGRVKGSSAPRHIARNSVRWTGCRRAGARRLGRSGCRRCRRAWR